VQSLLDSRMGMGMMAIPWNFIGMEVDAVGEFHGDENKCGNPAWMETRVAGLSHDVKEKQKQRRILS